MPARTAAMPGLGGAAEGGDRDAAERVGDRDALEAEPRRAARRSRSAARRRPASARRPGRSRVLSITIVAAGRDEAPVGRLVDARAARPSRGRSAGPRSRCWRGRCRSRGSAWRWRRRRRPAGRAAKGTAVAATAPAVEPKPRSVSAMSPPGRATSRTGARSTLTPTSRRLAAVRAPCSRLKAAPRAPICAAEAVGAPSSRFTRPPSWSTITSSGSRRPAGRGIACSSAISRRPAARLGKFSAKRIDPGDPAFADHPL